MSFPNAYIGNPATLIATKSLDPSHKHAGMTAFLKVLFIPDSSATTPQEHFVASLGHARDDIK